MDSISGAIINSQFCVAYPIDLAFTTKPPGDKRSGELATVDAAGNILFRAKNSSLNGFTQLRDAAGHTILTMKAKFRTLHDRWQAFTGDSTEAKDLVFSIKRSSALQIHDEWFVYLSANTKEEKCDFKIVGSYRKKNCTIYKGDSSFVVAQLSKEHKLNVPLEKHAFGATISADCDYSFVSALITLFHGIDATRRAAGARAARNAAAASSAGAASTAAASAAAASGGF